MAVYFTEQLDSFDHTCVFLESHFGEKLTVESVTCLFDLGLPLPE